MMQILSSYDDFVANRMFTSARVYSKIGKAALGSDNNEDEESQREGV